MYLPAVKLKQTEEGLHVSEINHLSIHHPSKVWTTVPVFYVDKFKMCSLTLNLILNYSTLTHVVTLLYILCWVSTL